MLWKVNTTLVETSLKFDLVHLCLISQVIAMTQLPRQKCADWTLFYPEKQRSSHYKSALRWMHRSCLQEPLLGIPALTTSSHVVGKGLPLQEVISIQGPFFIISNHVSEVSANERRSYIYKYICGVWLMKEPVVTAFVFGWRDTRRHSLMSIVYSTVFLISPNGHTGQ